MKNSSEGRFQNSPARAEHAARDTYFCTIYNIAGERLYGGKWLHAGGFDADDLSWAAKPALPVCLSQGGAHGGLRPHQHSG